MHVYCLTSSISKFKKRKNLLSFLKESKTYTATNKVVADIGFQTVADDNRIHQFIIIRVVTQT